jgi:pimeloyl-ACP methyl ester carboxylesterase
MQAQFFGNSDSPLYGVYHPPTAKRVHDKAVLLCYPVGHAYMRAHWAFRRLAKMLSEAGFNAFRFDYFGTGDSAGDMLEANIGRWISDIRMAAQELKDISGVQQISVVGLRLGAALAAEASKQGVIFRDLILWDPVITGKEYLAGLRALHLGLFPDCEVSMNGDHINDFLGFPFCLEMIQAIEKVNLLSPPCCVAKRISIIASSERTEYARLSEALKEAGAQVDYRIVMDAGEWDKIEEFDQALLVNDILYSIVAAVSE